MTAKHSKQSAIRVARGLKTLLSGLAALGVAAGLSEVAQAATITVAPGVVEINASDGQCSLREATVNAYTDAQTHADCAAGTGEDIIELAVGATYTLTTEGLGFAETVTVEGHGSTIARDDNAPKFGILVTTGLAGGDEGFVALNDLTIRNGWAMRSGFDELGFGGGISHTFTTLTLTNCTISNCVAREGGGIRNLGGTVNLINCTITDNTADEGAGINNGVTLNVINSTISHNRGFDRCVGLCVGGGIASSGTLSVINSTISHNSMSSGTGGGVWNEWKRTAIFTNTTISHNSSGTSGGIANDGGFVELINCTVTQNNATLAMSSGIGNGGVLKLSNTIVANQLTGPDCAGLPMTSLGHNLDSDGSCNLTALGDIPNGNANLGPLQDNGGLTETHAPLPGSDALDAGDDAICAGDPINGVDQRGVSRPQGAACDIGAFELGEEGPNGQVCSYAGECQSGHCVDGFCCDAACDVSCDLCDVAGAEGTCTAFCQLYGDVFPIGPPHGNCVVDIDDIVCLITGFGSQIALCPSGDLYPCGGNGVLDIDDLLAVLLAFAGDFRCPAPCPA